MRSFGQAGINIHALTVSDTVDHAVVRMLVSDSTKALMLLGERGVLAFENDVLMIEAPNERGVLGKIADGLSRAEVNIEYAYFATSANSPKGLIILRPSNVEKAQRCEICGSRNESNSVHRHAETRQGRLTQSPGRV